MGIDVMKGTGDDDFPAGRRVIPPVVLTGGNYPGENRCGENARRQQC